jgi:hypothetical protein
VKTSYLCVRTLIFSFVLLLLFVKFFLLSPFHFFNLAFIIFSPFFNLIFYHPLFFFLFSLLFCTYFLAHIVLSLPYPNLVKNKRLSLLSLFDKWGVDSHVVASTRGLGGSLSRRIHVGFETWGVAHLYDTGISWRGLKFAWWY